MGMFSEANAIENAKKLEKILIEASNGPEWSTSQNAVKKFVKNHLYEWYLQECSEAFMNPNEEIVKIYG